MLLLVFLAHSCGFAPAPFPRPRINPFTDLPHMQGAWKVTKYAVRGREIPSTRMRVEIAGQIMTIRSTTPQGESHAEWSFAVNADRRLPRFDLTGGDAPARGIYRLRGAVLTISISLPGRDRPDGFGINKDGWLIVLRR
jgi:uncharacterized protein (TIGR03067 family)